MIKTFNLITKEEKLEFLTFKVRRLVCDNCNTGLELTTDEIKFTVEKPGKPVWFVECPNCNKSIKTVA